MSHSELYCDYNSTSPAAEGVREMVSLYLNEKFGNPSNASNILGRQAKASLEDARQQLSNFMGCFPDEVVFTSGGTESVFAAILGVFRALPRKRHFIFSEVEHPAVQEAAEFLRDMCGVRLSRIPVCSEGMISLSDIEAAISDDTALLSFMAANNETGILFPIRQISELAARNGVLFHTDAVQAVGKESLTFSDTGADLLSLSGHKIGAPKGVGALLIRTGTPWLPVMKGGGQEQGRRGGTESLPLIAGLGVAAGIRRKQLASGMVERVRAVRDTFEQEILRIPGVALNGSKGPRLSNTSNFQVSDIVASDLAERLSNRRASISTGSACKSASLEPSPVLRAMGLSVLECLSSIRVSFGPESSIDEAKKLSALFAEEVPILRQALAGELKQVSRKNGGEDATELV